MADVNMFTTPFQLTKSMHRDVYPAVDPSNPELSAKGKIIIITGAGGGLGAVSSPLAVLTSNLIPNLRYCARQSQELGLRLVLPVSSLLDARPKHSISPSTTLPRLINRSLSSPSLQMCQMNPASSRFLPRLRPSSAKRMSWSTRLRQ